MSVNGKPFKPDPTSYQMTGIPCGNPARYKSRGVIRMTRSEIPYENQQVGIPGRGTESEAETMVQNLIKNQFNASTEYARKTLNFTVPARGGELLVPSASGLTTLAQFQKVSEGDSEANQMRGLGFSNHQINHLLTQRGLMEEVCTERRRKTGNIVPHPDFVRSGIQEMLEAKEQKEAELEAEYNFDPAKNISRHRAQLESAILQNKKHPLANIYHKKAHGGNKPNSPEQELSLEPFSQKRRKNNPYDVEEALPVDPNKKKRVRKEDDSNGEPLPAKQVDVPLPDVLPAHQAPTQAPTPVPPKPVVLTSKIESIPEETLVANKLAEDKILEQFPNYEKGVPTKVIYLKNLDKQAGVKDLVSLFIRFQEEGKDKISFKLMDGKMKGQAFVTFHDEPTATAALNLVHGYIFNNKPIIIQYGKAK